MAPYRPANENPRLRSVLARTSWGHEFDPTRLHWNWRGPLISINFDFDWIASRFPGLLRGAQQVLSFIAENQSEYSLRNNFGVLLHFLKNCAPGTEPLQEVSAVHLLNYRSSGQSENGRMSSLSSFLRIWQVLEQPGVHHEVFRLLDVWRLNGNEKGRAVATFDPFSGPLTDLEREALLAALHDNFAVGAISLEDYCLALLAMIIAARPAQLAVLKVGDLKHDGQNGKFTLMVPRAKQRHSPPRSAFTARPLTADVGRLLERLAESVKSRVGCELRDPEDAPIFPIKNKCRSSPPHGFEFHQSASNLARKVSALISDLKAQSERTGNVIHAGIARFRRTLGTNAAKEGLGARIIAALLDHSDTQNVSVYVEASTEFIQHLDRAMAMKLAPLAQAFSGVLVGSEHEAKLGGRSENRISGPGIVADDRGVGTCGNHHFCGLSAPLACYTCRLFQPWREGPHEQVLAWLLRDRERLMALGDPVIARIRDRVILAVAEVVLACEEASENRV